MEDISGKEERNFESSRVVNSPDGWITPTGTFYGCSPDEHDVSAGYLLRTHRANIEHRLQENHQREILSNIDKTNARTVLKAAGFALLSNGLMAETNLPKSLTTRQLELMQRSNLSFTPESGRLPPDVYLEFLKLLQGDPRIAEIRDSLDYDSQLEMDSFLKTPSRALVLSNIYGTSSMKEYAEEIYDITTVGKADEISVEISISRDVIKWKPANLHGARDAYVQYERHEHAGNPYRDDEDYYLALVSGKEVRSFIESMSVRHDVLIYGDVSKLK